MIMKRLAAALLLLCAPVAAHAADNFTFTTTAKAIDGVRVPATGPSFGGARVFNFSSDTVYADGHKETTGGKCSDWRNPPGAQFPQSGVCNSPQYDVQYSCGAPDANGANCWGLLTGKDGKYKGRTAVIAYRSTTTSIGVGRWND
jgi:hypothetical protein